MLSGASLEDTACGLPGGMISKEAYERQTEGGAWARMKGHDIHRQCILPSYGHEESYAAGM